MKSRMLIACALLLAGALLLAACGSQATPVPATEAAQPLRQPRHRLLKVVTTETALPVGGWMWPGNTSSSPKWPSWRASMASRSPKRLSRRTGAADTAVTTQYSLTGTMRTTSLSWPVFRTRCWKACQRGTGTPAGRGRGHRRDGC